MNKNKKAATGLRFDLGTAVITLFIALVAAVSCQLLYGVLSDLWLPLAVGLIFLIFSAAVLLCLFIWSTGSKTFQENVLTGHHDRHSVPAILAAMCLLIFLLALAAQVLYSLSFSAKSASATSYIFAVDESSSMTSSDPKQKRYEAIQKTLEKKDPSFPYMVYTFGSNVNVLQEMTTVGEGLPHMEGKADGGTRIKQLLEQVLSDHRNGLWDGGSSPKLILLTDGAATDISTVSEINDVLDELYQRGIVVCPVGMEQSDDTLMNHIAQRTHGNYIRIENLDDLSDAVEQAANFTMKRSLLERRAPGSLDWLYGLLRILFLTILGSILNVACAIAYGRHETGVFTLAAGAAKAFLSSLVMEVGTNALYLDAPLCAALMLTLMGTLLAVRGENSLSAIGNSQLDDADHSGTGKKLSF